MRTVILTSRCDHTATLVQARMPGQVIRCDLDDLQHLGMRCDGSGWSIAGERVDVPDVAVYWRKPAEGMVPPEVNQLTAFEHRQRLHLFRSFCADMLREGRWLLVDPLHEYHVPKSLQLRVAQRLFRVPQWMIAVGPGGAIGGDVVSKAFAPVPVRDGKHLVTTRVADPSRLDRGYLWYLQELVDATHDATVLYCCGKVWAFGLPRPADAAWIDWRLIESNHRHDLWHEIAMPDPVRAATVELMQTLGLNFGRIDFLISGTGWEFLEVNPNGQFAWLDPLGDRGILSWVAQCAAARPREHRSLAT